MYIPAAFAMKDREQALTFIEQYSFGTLVAADGASLEATHLPFVVERHADGSATLLGHVARANPHARAIESGAAALAIFTGPHAYVSPRWYGPGAAVPTWNYAAVHVSGALRAITEPDTTRALLQRVTAIHEARASEPWSLSVLAPDLVDRMLGAIIAFELPVARLEAKFKFNQNRTEADQRGVVAGLRALAEPSATEAADFMARVCGLLPADPVGSAKLS
jgi:transcriptional regulator